MSILFSDSFYDGFKGRLKVDEDVITNTFKNPDRIQHLENNLSLYLKEFPDKKLSYLLVCTAIVEGITQFSFAYWIPREFISEDKTPVDILEVFANNFGCKIKIADQERYFIEKSSKLIQGKLESPFQIMEILGSPHIPCESYLFFKESQIYNLNYVTCYYCFAINNNRYKVWLYEVETVTIKVKSGWYNYLSEIKDVLDPFGKTALTVLKPKAKITEEGLNSKIESIAPIEEELDLEIPKSYLPPFSHINTVISTLGKNEKIAVIPKFERIKCLFCDSEDTSKEHIFPQWMRAYFEEKIFDGTLHCRLPEEDLISALQTGISKRKESSYGFTTHQVCVNCNETWMSQLENKVKSLLTKTHSELKSNLVEFDFNEENAQQIALWILIKALLLANKDNLTPVIPENSYQEIKNRKIPEGFLIEMTDCEAYNLNFVVTKGADFVNLLRLKSFDLKTAQRLTKDFFMVCLQIGNFLFRVSYFDESNGLKREGCIKRTNILYPSKFDLPYKTIEDEEEKWKAVLDSIKLHIFSISISLTDY